MNQSAFDEMAKKLHADTNKAMGKATTARKAKDFAEQQKGAQSRVDREEKARVKAEKARVKLAAETPAADTPPSNGGVDPKRAEDARASAAEQRAPSTTGERPKHAPKQGTFGPDKGKMRAGLVKAYAEAHPEALKRATALAKEAGFNFGKSPLGAQLHYLVEAEGGEAKGQGKMLKWVKSTKGGAATTTPTTTTPATPPPASKPATVLDPDAVEGAKASAKHVSRRDMKTTLKFVSEKTGRSVADLKRAAEKSPLAKKKYLANQLDADQLEELNPKPGETKGKGKGKPATTTTPTTAQPKAGMGEAQIKKAVKAQQAKLAKSPEMRETFATGPTNNPVRQSVLSELVKKHGQADGRAIYDRVKAAEAGAPPPTAASKQTPLWMRSPRPRPSASPGPSLLPPPMRWTRPSQRPRPSLHLRQHPGGHDPSPEGC